MAESTERPKINIQLSSQSRASKAQQSIVREIYPESDLDNGLVGWDGQDDPMHPR